MRHTKENLFQQTCAPHLGGSELQSRSLQVIQVNVGLLCNLECQHCHVAASPRRQEQMSWETMQQVVSLIRRSGCRFVDLTGGAPELNPHFKPLIRVLRQQDVAVQVRTNLTVLMETDYEDMASFFREQQVSLVASMPCYLEQNVDSQRGMGVYQQAISAIKKLNALGYGCHPDKVLNLVYNPSGARLPSNQKRLEADYRRELRQRFDIEFSHLLTITNMPIGRFMADLRRRGQEFDYWDLLHQSFNPSTLDHLMCRNQISIRWDGTLFDCDFNLALGLPVQVKGGNHINNCNTESLSQRTIITRDHCLGCTAGCGSSCGGALAA